MTVTTLFITAIIVGIVAGVYLPLNGRLAGQLDSPLLATAIFFTVGATTALIAWFALGDGKALSRLAEVDRGLLLLGVVSFLIIISATIFIPLMGPGAYFVCTIAGQVVAGVVLSHYGLFTPEKLPITPLKLVGVAALVGGVILIHYVESGQTAAVEKASQSGIDNNKT